MTLVRRCCVSAGVWTGTGVNVLEKSDLGQWWCLHLSLRERMRREEGEEKS